MFYHLCGSRNIHSNGEICCGTVYFHSVEKVRVGVQQNAASEVRCVTDSWHISSDLVHELLDVKCFLYSCVLLQIVVRDVVLPFKNKVCGVLYEEGKQSTYFISFSINAWVFENQNFAAATLPVSITSSS